MMQGGSLADGQLAASPGAVIYTCPTDANVAVYIRLAAVDANPYGVSLFVTRVGSTARRITGFSYTIGATGVGGHDTIPTGDKALRLSAGDTISGYASTAAKVDYVIDGGQSTE